VKCAAALKTVLKETVIKGTPADIKASGAQHGTVIPPARRKQWKPAGIPGLKIKCRKRLSSNCAATVCPQAVLRQRAYEIVFPAHLIYFVVENHPLPGVDCL
jgi:hypothetical protein